MGRVSLPAMSISWIDFGAPSAENDIERGLGEYFVESEAYERVRFGAKRIVIGSRGFLLAAGIRGNGRRRSAADTYLGVHQVPYLNIAAAQSFQVHSMFWAHLGSGPALR